MHKVVNGIKVPLTEKEIADVEALAVAHAAAAPREAILSEIIKLEGSISPRKLREALLGDESAKADIAAIEADIAALRAQL